MELYAAGAGVPRRFRSYSRCETAGRKIGWICSTVANRGGSEEMRTGL